MNWSLKLHFRLRTISLLISTHITHVYVQRMSYSFVWLYLIKCIFTCSIFVDQTQIFFECFCFWKVFCFYKKCQNFQKQCCPILATWSRISPVAYPQLWAYTVGFHDSLASHCPSCEKYLEIFSKIWVFRFLMTQTGDLFTGESSSHEGYTEIFVAPFATSSRVELSVAKNT